MSLLGRLFKYKAKKQVDVDRLITALGDEDSGVRSGAASALGKIGDKRAVEPLITALGDKNSDVLWSAARALGEIGAPAVEPLITVLGDKNSRGRKRITTVFDRHGFFDASHVFGEIGEPAVEPLITALGDENSDVRSGAASALVKIGDKRAVEPLITALGDEDSSVRWYAADALGEIGDKRAVEPLITALGDENSDGRKYAADALGEIGDKRAVEPLITALGNKDSDVHWSVARALGWIGDKRAVEPLITALGDGGSSARWNAARALGRIGDMRGVPALEKAINDSNKDVRKNAKEAFDKIKSSDAYKECLRGYYAFISSIESEIAELMSAGVEIPEAEELLEQAKSELSKNNFEQAKELANRAKKAAKKIQEESKPEITLNFPEATLQLDRRWKRIDITIQNTGSMHAKDISIEPSGDIEFRRMPTIPQLNINETETIAIAIKPTVMGDVPIDIALAYKDALDRDYTSSEEVWVSVIGSTSELIPIPTAATTQFTTFRTVWDPIDKDFVWGTEKPDEYGELPRIKQWIEGNNPHIYWFLLKIVNHADYPVTEWNVTLYTEQALTITEAHLNEKPVRIMDERFDRNEYKKIYVASVSPELGMSIPAKSERMMYFKMGIVCEGALKKEFGVFGVVRLGKSQQMEVPIREKRFIYKCKQGDFENMFYRSIDALTSLTMENLQNSYSREIVQNFTNSFRLIREFEKYCNDRYAESEILIGKLEVVHSSLRAAEPITKDEILPLVEENLAALRMMSGVEAQKERGMRMCEKLVELLHIATSKIK